MPRCPQITHTGVSRRGVSQVNVEKERCGYSVVVFFSSNHTLDFEIRITNTILSCHDFRWASTSNRCFFSVKKESVSNCTRTESQFQSTPHYYDNIRLYIVLALSSWCFVSHISGAELKWPLVPAICYQLKARVTLKFSCSFKWLFLNVFILSRFPRNPSAGACCLPTL